MWRRAPEFWSSKSWIDLDLFGLGEEFDTEVLRLELEWSFEGLLFEMEDWPEFLPRFGVGQLTHHVTQLIDQVIDGQRWLIILELVNEIIIDVNVRLVAPCREG